MGISDLVESHQDGDYRILIGAPKDLVKAVAKAQRNGWKTVGHAVKYAVLDNRLSQTMTRESK